MSGFTPGPWHAVHNGHYVDITTDRRNHCLASTQVNEYLGIDDGVERANANLIAAAPELFEALQDAMKFSMSEEAYNKCAAAVSKALGQ